MNNLYKRIVTMGMISFSALLAWLYCIIAYRDKIAYVICLSLILVISLYALFNAIIKVRLIKDEAMYKYISDTISSTVASMVPDTDSAREAERIAKATYVQLRKANSGISSLAEANNTNTVKNIDNYTALSLSMRETVTKAMTDSAKLVVKYNKQDNQNVMDMLKEFTLNMENISQSLDSINNRIDNMNIVAEKRPKTILEDTVMDDTLPDMLDIFPQTSDTPASSTENAATMTEAPSEEISITPNDDIDPNKPLSPDEIAALFSQAMANVPDDTPVAREIEEPVIEEPVAVTPVSDDPNQLLSQDDITALFSQAAAAEPAPEPVIEEPVVTAPVSDDPNRQLTPDEIAALFSQSVEERTAKSEADFENATSNEAMDQNLIDALLNNLNSEPEPEEPAADEKIIPFPAVEEPVATAPVEEPFDPNKPLSPDEIAALFASMNGN